MHHVLRLCLVALAGLAFVQAGEVWEENFDAFKVHFDKTYSSPEAELRAKQNFLDNIADLPRLRKEQPKAIFGVTHLSDLSHDEFRETYLMRSTETLDASQMDTLDLDETQFGALPSTFDWREKYPKSVTPVKDQGACGSCWAFSTTENIESVLSVQKHVYKELSTQQITSCTYSYNGCEGGGLQSAMSYAQKHGVELASDYPYVTKHNKAPSCAFNRNKVAAKFAGFKSIERKGNETHLMAGIHQYNPLAICLDATEWSSSYKGGIFRSCPSGTKTDHCVQVVGWGQNSKGKYWLIRNSWSKSWGVDGYMWLERTGHGDCAVAVDAFTVTV